MPVMLQEEISFTFALLRMVWTLNVRKYQAYLAQKIHYFKKCFKFNIQIDSIILFFKIQNIWKIIQWKPFFFLGPPITEFLVQEARVWLISFVIFPEIFYSFIRDDRILSLSLSSRGFFFLTLLRNASKNLRFG